MSDTYNAVPDWVQEVFEAATSEPAGGANKVAKYQKAVLWLSQRNAELAIRCSSYNKIIVAERGRHAEAIEAYTQAQQDGCDSNGAFDMMCRVLSPKLDFDHVVEHLP